jgi:hypothetical protein
MNFFLPYRSESAPIFGLMIAESIPEHKLAYRRKSDEREETASFWHRSCPGSMGEDIGSVSRVA